MRPATRKIILTSFFFLLLCSFTLAQKITIRLADKSYADFAFIEAIGLYEFAYEKNPEDTYVIRQLAKANQKIGDTESVEKWLKLLIDCGEESPEDVFSYSQVLKSNGRYQEAEKLLARYAQLKPGDERIDSQTSLLEQIRLLHRDSTRYKIRPVSLNTDGSELGVAFYRDQLVFSSTKAVNGVPGLKYKWNELPYLNLFIGDRGPNGDILNVEKFAPKLETSYHDGPVAFDPYRDRVYITRNNVGKGHNVSKGKDGEVNLKILFGGKEQGEWEYRGEFVFNSDDYSTGHPAVDTTGSVLYFVSDMPGGYGGTDIYRSEFSGGYWTEPENLGPAINTSGNELSPFVSYDGLFYFSSDGHGGLGGLDVYVAVPENETFHSVKNMGYPLNSPKDDFSFVLDKTGTAGYLSSNRKGGRGNDDIYYVRIPSVPVFIRGVVNDMVTGQPLAGAKISLVNPFADTLSTQLTSADGMFQFEVNKGLSYTIQGQKEYYFKNKVELGTLKLREGEETTVQLLLEREVLEEGEPEPLYMETENGEPLQVLSEDDVQFYNDSWVINSEIAHTMDGLIDYLVQFPDVEIRIESHTDSRGDDQENLLLSKRRAKAIFNYIVWKGINPLRIVYKGYGETRLLNNCDDGVDCPEADHAANIRNIVKVVKKGEYQGVRAKRSISHF
ncbi:OmpA family protein [uncultured Sunxiuqinia sp.]|uniref:OmpA family protein n=1 Tax=uncultured Sunxiuqinia sp. TaxID=1573825 RepID=UPI002604A4F1|nr:OmpA family protein [uncultured Sunxiuqinia sp.]